MIFKIFFALLKKLRWIVATLLLVGGIYLVAVQYQQIKASPLGSFLPDLTWESVTKTLPSALPTFATASPTPSATITPETSLIVSIATEKGPVSFTAEIADTDEERALGLMYRTSLAPYAGMYFIFDRDIQGGGFWMKNCEIPLDMLFIDSQGKIIDLRENVRPCKEIDPTQTTCPSYVPALPYRYVLEINGGSAKANGIKSGNITTTK